MPPQAPPPLHLARGGGARVTDYIDKLQQYLTSLTYNHTGTQVRTSSFLLTSSSTTSSSSTSSSLQLFDIKPHSSMITLMETARSMVRAGSFSFLQVRESLPIKCMEAVVLAIYLTNGIPGLGRFVNVANIVFIIIAMPRFPINFKSEVQEKSLLRGRKYFYHVVLGLAYKGRKPEHISKTVPGYLPVLLSPNFGSV